MAHRAAATIMTGLYDALPAAELFVTGLIHPYGDFKLLQPASPIAAVSCANLARTLTWKQPGQLLTTLPSAEGQIYTVRTVYCIIRRCARLTLLPPIKHHIAEASHAEGAGTAKEERRQPSQWPDIECRNVG